MVGPKFNHSPLWIVVEQGVEYDGSRQGELTFLEKWNYHSSDELVGAEAAGLWIKIEFSAISPLIT